MRTAISGGGPCPLCGVEHTACGQATAGAPVDIPIGKGAATVATSRYNVMINGQRRVLKLSAEDAKRYEGAELVTDDQADTDTEAPTKGRRAASNKARTAANKAE